MEQNKEQPKEKKELAVIYKIDDNEITLTPKIVQDYIVGSGGNITLAEFKFFTELCKVQKLNPFLKEAYCIKYGSAPATIVVGKDVFIKRAVAHPQYNGKESGIMVMKEDSTTVIERNGCFFAPDETVIGGWARVFRKDREHPEYMSVSLEEVAGRKDGKFNSSWANKKATMVEKVAKVRALREAFIDEFQGMYVEEEFEPEKPEKDIIETEAEVIESVEAEEVDLKNV